MRSGIRVQTLPLTDVPIGRGLTVTVPFIASSRTLADTVVLIGTPSLLTFFDNSLKKGFKPDCNNFFKKRYKNSPEQCSKHGVYSS